MFKKALIGAVAIALSSGVADAGENKFTKEEGVGMGSGAAIGAVVGGPIGAFVGLIAGMTAVGLVAFRTDVAYLWQNVIGAAVVVGVGIALSGRRIAIA